MHLRYPGKLQPSREIMLHRMQPQLLNLLLVILLDFAIYPDGNNIDNFPAMFYGPVTHINLTHQETCCFSARPVPARSFLDDHGGGKLSLNHPPPWTRWLHRWMLDVTFGSPAQGKSHEKAINLNQNDSSFLKICSHQTVNFLVFFYMENPSSSSGSVSEWFISYPKESRVWGNSVPKIVAKQIRTLLLGVGKNAPRKLLPWNIEQLVDTRTLVGWKDMHGVRL